MRKLILVIACLGLAGGVFAQKASKVGHMNSQEIMYLMPQSQSISDSLQIIQKSKERQVANLQAELQKMVADAERDVGNGTLDDQSMIALRQAEISDKQQRIQEYVKIAQDQLLKAEQDLMVPLQEQVLAAIKAVSEEGEFSYVLDLSSGAVIYFEGGIDISPMVKEKLGIDPNKKLPSAEGPGQ
jgi:outer membrane protein